MNITCFYCGVNRAIMAVTLENNRVTTTVPLCNSCLNIPRGVLADQFIPVHRVNVIDEQGRIVEQGVTMTRAKRTVAKNKLFKIVKEH